MGGLIFILQLGKHVVDLAYWISNVPYFLEHNTPPPNIMQVFY